MSKNYDEELEENYNDFWKEIIEKEDGTLDKEQVKKELYDYSIVMMNCELAYIEMTNGEISKPNTKFYEVRYIFEDRFLNKEYVQDDVMEMIQSCSNIDELKQELTDYFDLGSDK